LIQTNEKLFFDAEQLRSGLEGLESLAGLATKLSKPSKLP